MKKNKINLGRLKVNSFITNVEKSEIETVKGGRTYTGCFPTNAIDCPTFAECYLSDGSCPI